MLTKEQKKNYISEMTTQIENSKAVMVTHYQGLTMTQLDELRAKMREHGIIFKITKNRITKLALEKTKCKDLSNLFTGPTAVAFGEDAIISARILSKFAKYNENLKLIVVSACFSKIYNLSISNVDALFFTSLLISSLYIITTGRSEIWHSQMCMVYQETAVFLLLSISFLIRKKMILACITLIVLMNCRIFMILETHQNGVEN